MVHPSQWTGVGEEGRAARGVARGVAESESPPNDRRPAWSKRLFGEARGPRAARLGRAARIGVGRTRHPRKRVERPKAMYDVTFFYFSCVPVVGKIIKPRI